MIFKVDFNQKEIERLFLTYQQNPSNYSEIKKRLFGNEAKQTVQKSIRARLLFLLVLSIVAIVGSSYAYFFAEHWGSFGAIWIIWAGFVIGVGSTIFYSYKNAYLRMKNNEQFFDGFEKIATKSATLDDFRIDWNTKP